METGEVIFGLIGYPLGHSFSKQYFTQKIEQEGLRGYSFELFPLQNIREFPSLLRNHPSIRGLAVTIPYKEQVIPYLDRLDAVAAEAGAVNCIRVSGNDLTGFNTDIIGFRRSLEPLLQPWHSQALVLGTGGASKAVQYVLRQLHIPFLVVSRYPTNEKGYTTYGALDEEVLASHKLIVNCTPLGMMPDVDTCPDIPYSMLTPEHLLYDLVYKPPKTLFLQKGEAMGAVVTNGYEMLIIQAEANWAIWMEGL